jgi:hypothetical protein
MHVNPYFDVQSKRYAKSSMCAIMVQSGGNPVEKIDRRKLRMRVNTLIEKKDGMPWRRIIVAGIDRTLDILVSRYTDEVNAGQKPSITKYLSECPAHAREELSELLQFISDVKPCFQTMRQAEINRFRISLASAVMTVNSIRQDDKAVAAEVVHHDGQGQAY